MSGNELPKPINLSHPSWAGDDLRTRELRIRAAGDGYLYESCFDAATEENAQFRATVQLVEVTAMRECACTAAAPIRRSEPAIEALPSGSGPKQWARDRPVNYISQLLATRRIFPFTARPTQHLITCAFSELVIWSCKTFLPKQKSLVWTEILSTISPVDHLVGSKELAR